MDQRTKLMTMHKALHPRDDVARLQRVEDYIEKLEERHITASRNDTESTKTNRMAITRKNGKKNYSMVVLND